MLYHKIVHSAKGGELDSWLKKSPVSLIFFFCILPLVSIWIEGYLLHDESSMGLYLIPLIFAGFIYRKSILIQVVIAGGIAGIRYSLEPLGFPSISVVIFQWLVYTLAIITVSTLLKFYMTEKENILNLTLTLTLAKSMDSRDPYTAFHSENVANYALKIGIEMKLSRIQCMNLYIGGLLHDIGKIGVPESILTNPSRLTNEEYKIIKEHPVIGYEMVKHIPAFQKRGILDVILYHHERYDGTGYPKGLRGEKIPQIARIMAIADSFDAMTSRRIYRNEHDFDYAINEILKNKGTQFDPDIADIFIKIIKKEGTDMLSSRIPMH